MRWAWRPSTYPTRRRPAIADIVAGHVPMTITSVQGTKSLVEAGKIKALAVTSAVRSPAMPSVPTMQEAGVKTTVGVELRFGSNFRPKGLPNAVKARLGKALSAVMSNQEVATGWLSWTSRRTTCLAPR